MFELPKAIEKYFEDCQKGKNNLITSEALGELLKQGPNDLFLLDIRKKEDFEKGHIPGAFNTFWYEVGEIIDVLPKDKKIVVACYSGQSAGQVVSLLKVLGYDAYSLAGGMVNGWSKSNLPLEEGCG